MRNKSSKTKISILVCALVAAAIYGWSLVLRCSERPDNINLDPDLHIANLYPWPDAKIPFACSTWTFIKSPFAPKQVDLAKDVFKEDGFLVLGGYQREGVVVLEIFVIDELYHQFPEKVRLGTIPSFVKAVSLYVDGKELTIGHIGYDEFGNRFDFATILNPFLLPGMHIGKLQILLPSGKIMDYEWHFEITWW